MGKATPEKLWKRAVRDQLVQGREFATQLRDLLHKPFEDHGSVSAEKLASKIHRSFTEALSVMSSDDERQIPVTDDVGSDLSGDRTSQDSGQSRKGPAVKNFRGRYKRRKSSDSMIKVSPVTEDEYGWRKYGQKGILNSKYPRCYYRCTHKYDRGCMAQKQVQQMVGDNMLYHITYFGHHTCKNIPKPDSDHLESSIQSFDSNKKIPSIIPSVKEEAQSNDVPPPLDHTLWQDLMALDSSGPALSMMGSDHEDVLSSVHSCGSASSHGLDMEILIGSVDFDKDFQFDEI